MKANLLSDYNLIMNRSASYQVEDLVPNVIRLELEVDILIAEYEKLVVIVTQLTSLVLSFWSVMVGTTITLR